VRIAFTHNLQRSSTESEAEFDPPESVESICAAIERLGHRVEPIDVSEDPGEAISRLQATRPELVFNTAEGRRGPLREALFPSLFEELLLPYTGSSASTMAVTLDKRCAKLMAAAAGIPTPRWQFLAHLEELDPDALDPPLIVKPNFEGSSKGIRRDSVVEDTAELARVVADLLGSYPDGVLVEEFAGSRDVTVPFLETAVPDRGGVLEPVAYVFHSEREGREIYDYELKNERWSLVDVSVPASLPEGTAQALHSLASATFRIFGIRDFGRVDFRVADDGALSFLEMNPLPYLHPEAGIHAAAALEGLDLDGVVACVIESAARRFGLVAGS
jgi:D-alanine-D-alanine ligase